MEIEGVAGSHALPHRFTKSAAPRFFFNRPIFLLRSSAADFRHKDAGGTHSDVLWHGSRLIGETL